MKRLGLVCLAVAVCFAGVHVVNAAELFNSVKKEQGEQAPGGTTLFNKHSGSGIAQQPSLQKNMRGGQHSGVSQLWRQNNDQNLERAVGNFSAFPVSERAIVAPKGWSYLASSAVTIKQARADVAVKNEYKRRQAAALADAKFRKAMAVGALKARKKDAAWHAQLKARDVKWEDEKNRRRMELYGDQVQASFKAAGMGDVVDSIKSDDDGNPTVIKRVGNSSSRSSSGKPRRLFNNVE